MNSEKPNFAIEYRPIRGCFLYLAISFLAQFFIENVLYATCLVDFLFYGYILYRRKKYPINREAAPKRSQIVILITIACLILTTYFWSCWYMSNMTDSATESYTQTTQTLLQSNIYVYIFVISIAAPLGEESLFRYVVLNGFLNWFKRFNKPLQYTCAILVSSLVFAFMHGTGVHLLIGLFAGIAFSLAYLSTNNLTVSIFIHMCYNIGTMFLQIPESFTLSCVLTIISLVLTVLSIHVLTKT